MCVDISAVSKIPRVYVEREPRAFAPHFNSRVSSENRARSEHSYSFRRRGTISFFIFLLSDSLYVSHSREKNATRAQCSMTIFDPVPQKNSKNDASIESTMIARKENLPSIVSEQPTLSLSLSRLEFPSLQDFYVFSHGRINARIMGKSFNLL